MIKHVDVSQLRPGMYLRGLDVPMGDHPFGGNSFRLSHADLLKFQRTAVANAWIDTDRGVDVTFSVPDAPAVTYERAVRQAQALLAEQTASDAPENAAMAAQAATEVAASAPDGAAAGSGSGADAGGGSAAANSASVSASVSVSVSAGGSAG